MTAYHKAAKAAFAKDDFDDKSFWRGAQAMAYIKEGNFSAAKRNIKLMKTDKKESNDFLQNYKKALSYCVKHPKDEKLCQTFSPLNDHSKK